MSATGGRPTYLENFERSTQTLSRGERIAARNEIIMTEYHSGIPKDDIAAKFQISLRQLNRIIADIEKDAADWYKSLPRKTMIALHRDNSTKVYAEIRTLKSLRASSKDTDKKFGYTVSIIDAYSKYDKMVAEGATLERQKELTEEAERILAKSN